LLPAGFRCGAFTPEHFAAGRFYQVRQRPMRVNLSDVAASSAHVPPNSEGSRIRKVPSFDREKELLRIGPKRVDCCGSLCARNHLETFSTRSVLSVRWVPGRRILSNAIPANGLSAPTSDRSEEAECNAPPLWVLRAHGLLKLTPTGHRRLGRPRYLSKKRSALKARKK
jgi:hypothetical protein